MKAEDFPDEAWGEPPAMDAPPRTEWIGEWEHGVAWATGDGTEREYLCWFRECLVLDGHEDCCHHTWPVVVEVS